MLNTIRKADFLGIVPFFMYKEQFCNKTILGGILSICVSLAISVLGVYLFLIFVLRKKYTIYDSETKLGKATRTWTPEDFSIIVLDKYFNKIEESERYFGLSAEIWTDKRITLENGTVISKTIIEDIGLQKCNITNYKSFDLWRDEKLINESTCFSDDIYAHYGNSTGNFGGTGYTGIVIWIHLCNNDTSKNITNCYPRDISKAKLENIFIYVKFFDYYFKHDEFDNMSNPYIYSELVQASSSTYKRIWYEFQKIQYRTDIGFVFDNINTKEFVSLSSSYNSIDLRTSSTVKDSFSVLSLNMVDNTKTIKKEYYKFQELCADLGGLINLIFFIGKFLNYCFTINLYYMSIINENINNYLPKSLKYYSIIFQSKETVPILAPAGTLFSLIKSPFSHKKQFKLNNSNVNIISNPRDDDFQITPKISKRCCKNENLAKKIINNISQEMLNGKNKNTVSKYEHSGIQFVFPFNNNRNQIQFNSNKKIDTYISKEDEIINSNHQYPKTPILGKKKKFSRKIKLSWINSINPFIAVFPRNYLKSKGTSSFAKVELMLHKNIDISRYVNSVNMLEKISVCLLGLDNIPKLTTCYNVLGPERIEELNANLIRDDYLPEECVDLKKTIKNELLNKDK